MTANIAVSTEGKTPAQTVRRWISFDPAECRTCRVCETMCAIYHEGAARPAVARINVTFDEFAPAAAESLAAAPPITATVCLQCADAPCVAACPVGALSRDPETGAVCVDVTDGSPSACTGCMRCRKACPWDVPKRHPERKVAIKCDLCAGRDEGPLCVEICPLSGKALRIEASTLEADLPASVARACSVRERALAGEVSR